MNQQTHNQDPEDRGLSIVIAGALCLLLTIILCCRGEQPASPPVSMTGSATPCSDNLTACPTGWSCGKDNRCTPPPSPPAAQPEPARAPRPAPRPPRGLA